MFESANLKVKRANQHIAALDQGLREFFQTRPCRVVSEYDLNQGCYGVRVVSTTDMPVWVGIVIGDVIHNLRSGLEHVASDLYVLANGGDEQARKRSKFPMHQTRQNLVDTVNKGEIKPALPKVAEAIVDTIQPFEAGEKLLWALGQLWNIDKHRLPIVSFAVAQINNISARNERGFSVSEATAIVNVGGFCDAFGSDSPFTITNEGEASYEVFFDEIGLLERQPLIPTLVRMSQLTEQAITTITEAI